ncbi:MAG: aldehyde dehydrogenase (NADP(+)) [Ekhidna sp.]
MIEGANILGYSLAKSGHVILKAKEASTQNELPFDFFAATEDEIEKAVQLAKDAAYAYAQTEPEKRAQFLESIAKEIENLGSLLVERASAESGLPQARIEGERGRTCNQLRLFAEVVREGSWIEATIDLANPNRTPLPKPDTRKMFTSIGPVLIFTASNFPLAFSTAGGDTASALAAGCPVIVKAHEAHLGTNELVAKAIMRAAQKTGMPEGVFSSLNGDGFKTGEQLIKHKEVKAVTFTGSYRGGMALHKMSQEREEPVPFFAEMGSINPVIICSGILKNNAEEVASTYASSITMGVGQFCTNPGLLIAVSSTELDHFKDSLSQQLNGVPMAPMLTAGIEEHFINGKTKALSQNHVDCLTDESKSSTLASISAKKFIGNPVLHEEIFGPMSLLVECESEEERLVVVENLKGQLTGTIMANESDQLIAGQIAQILENKVGRIIWNNPPTGVEVCHAMHHGGPFPATTDSRFTSVGVSAIKRFARPICYQNFPESLLPIVLRDQNEFNIPRKVDGDWIL